MMKMNRVGIATAALLAFVGHAQGHMARADLTSGEVREWNGSLKAVGDTPLTLTATSFGTASASGFGTYIEGAAVDASSGYVYAVNFGGNDRRNTVGRVRADGTGAEVFFTSTDGGSFNGIRVHSPSGDLFVADPDKRRVLRVNAQTRQATVLCSVPTGVATGIQIPNDLEMTLDGTRLYLSGMNYDANTGALMWCQLTNAPAAGATAQLINTNLKRTNGIALSPDDSILYISDAVTNQIQRLWSFRTSAQTGVDVSTQTLFYDFAAMGEAGIDSDGMRTDVAGNLYVTRNGGGKVVRFSSAGVQNGVITLNLQYPTNVDLGGTDGKTLYAVGRCGNAQYGTGQGCMNSAPVDQVGRAWLYQVNARNPTTTTTAPPTSSTTTKTPVTTASVNTQSSPPRTDSTITTSSPAPTSAPAPTTRAPAPTSNTNANAAAKNGAFVGVVMATLVAMVANVL